ncbi:MAG: hypothetical protein NWE98_07000 [Candidatus Bathyarchaeota archaeon]|nr:hypothetical protein [Candidatus Bathyarchaeota archaeon]
MTTSEKAFEFLKQASHRLPRKPFLIVNEGFEVTRGYMESLRPYSKDIRKIQKQLLREKYSVDTKQLIIFLTPGVDMVNGGILSITSLFQETSRLRQVHGSEVILCNYPTDPPLLKYTKFDNDNYLFNFKDALQYFTRIEKLTIHIPEHFIYRFFWFISRKNKRILTKIRDAHINILIQNIEFLPSVKYLRRLWAFGKLTATTAHAKYSNETLRNRLGFPLHRLSVFISPESYNFKKYSEKQDLMIVSPDKNPQKNQILQHIAQKLPFLKVQVIKNLTYEDYKETISNAKWALTFGEGLDGYFIETVFSGGVGISVFNENFFTSDFKNMRTIFPSYADLENRIVHEITALNNENTFSEYQKKQFEVCKKLYNYECYLKNLKDFYEGEYTFK